MTDVDLVIYDIQHAQRVCLSSNKTNRVNVNTNMFVSFSNYFPFDKPSVNAFISGLDDNDYILGVGYGNKRNNDTLRDIQIGVTGGVLSDESVSDAIIREVCEETALDLNVSDVKIQSNFYLGKRHWSTYYTRILDSTRLADICHNLNESRSRKSVSVMVAGKLKQFTDLYDNVDNSIRCNLSENRDEIRFILFISKKMLNGMYLDTSINMSRTHYEMSIISVNDVPINEYCGVVTGYCWNYDKFVLQVDDDGFHHKRSKRTRKQPVVLYMNVTNF